jgi:hypothetical protein
VSEGREKEGLPNEGRQDAIMSQLFRDEQYDKYESWDRFSESVCHLEKGPYYLGEIVSVDVEGSDGEKEIKERTLWVPNSESEAKAKLERLGLVDYVNKRITRERQRAFINSEIQEFLDQVKRVDYAGPLAGREAGIREFNGTKILVTQDPKLVYPEKGDWPGLQAIFKRMFGDDQIDYFYSWYQRVLQSVYSGKAISLHFFAMCGPVNSGKTWLQEAVISEMLGGYGSPNQYMSEGTPFNADLFSKPHQMLSDAKGSITYEKRRTFASFVKDMVANSGHRCHGKGDKALELDPIWVATCSCNTSPIERLRILPPLDDDIRDKMIITLINPGKMPIGTATAEGREEFRVWTKRQLPAFAWWLLNEYTIPADISLQDRFGVKGYCHPQIEQQLLELSPDARVRDYIYDALFSRGQKQTWRGTAEELGKLFNTEEGQKVFRSVKGRLSDLLSRLAKVHPNQFAKKKNNDQRFWVITAPEHD